MTLASCGWVPADFLLLQMPSFQQGRDVTEKNVKLIARTEQCPCQGLVFALKAKIQLQVFRISYQELASKTHVIEQYVMLCVGGGSLVI